MPDRWPAPLRGGASFISRTKAPTSASLELPARAAWINACLGDACLSLIVGFIEMGGAVLHYRAQPSSSCTALDGHRAEGRTMLRLVRLLHCWCVHESRWAVQSQ